MPRKSKELYIPDDVEKIDEKKFRFKPKKESAYDYIDFSPISIETFNRCRKESVYHKIFDENEFYCRIFCASVYEDFWQSTLSTHQHFWKKNTKETIASIGWWFSSKAMLTFFEIICSISGFISGPISCHGDDLRKVYK